MTKIALYAMLAIAMTLSMAGIAQAGLYWGGTGTWDQATTARWGTVSGGPYDQLWGNNSDYSAIFEGVAGTATVDGVIAQVNSVTFNSSGYSVSGGTLTLAKDADISIASGTATIGSTLDGSADPEYHETGLIKSGGGTLVLTGANTYTGKTYINEGVVTYSGSGSYSGAGLLYLGSGESQKAVLNIATTGTVTISGDSDIGADNNSAGAINQTSGTFNLGSGENYLQLGGSNSGSDGSSYGTYNLAGGTLSLSGNRGFRIGHHGMGVYTQTGGTLDCTRYFAIGCGNSNGNGVANFLGGKAAVGPSYNILMGDKDGSMAVLNLGTEAGGDAVLTTLNSSGVNVGNKSGSLAVVNLNSGTLELGGSLYADSGTGFVNLNGATLRSSSRNISFFRVSSLAGVYLYNGGATFDVFDVSYARSDVEIQTAQGNGVYVDGGTLNIASGGGDGYIGAPLVEVSGGTGLGAMAIAEVAGGAVTGVTLTCPGQNYEVGDVLSFAFSGGGCDTAASTFAYTLTAADVAANSGGDITKIGNSQLIFFVANSYNGATYIDEGELQIRNADALGSTAGKTVVADGAQLCAGGRGTIGYVYEDIDLNGLGADYNGALQCNDGASGGSIATEVDYAGTITLATDSGIGSKSGNEFSISGMIVGSGDLNKLTDNTIILTGDNTYTGDTIVWDGTLSITKAYLADASDVYVEEAGLLDLDFIGEDVISSVYLGVAHYTAAGTYGSTDSGAQYANDSYFSGTGMLRIVPEPGTFALLATGLFGLIAYAWRKRRR